MEINEFETSETEVKENWKITSDSEATWAMRKLSVVMNQINTNESIAKKEKERIDAWLEESNKSLNTKGQFFIDHLTAYAHEQREKFDRKTISTPYGKVTSRQLKEKFEIDKEKFIAWSLDNFDNSYLLRIKHEPDMEMIKKDLKVEGNVAVTSDGEVVPGVIVKPSEVSYKVEIGE